MKIIILGGSGYIGSLLSKILLSKNHKIKVIDTFWFGKKIQKHKNLKIVKKDIRNLNKNDLIGYDTIIHLANIANDPSVELNPKLSWDVNVLASIRLCELARLAKIKKIIYSSSGSVYGISNKKKVTEETELHPLSVYNKTKMTAEKIFLSYSNEFKIVIIRPATVCGNSERLRLDVSVNMLTYQAWKFKVITVMGGKQIRPNIHIRDLCNIFQFFLTKNISGIFNAGFENLSILKIAKKIQTKTKCKIKIIKSNDPRSYKLNSDKILRIGYKQKNNVEKAINELLFYFEKTKYKASSINYNIKRSKILKIK